MYDESKLVKTYNEARPLYQFAWSLDSAMALHCAYYDETTKNFQQALTRLNEVVAEIASINTNHKVLDAGCGVGGSAIWLALNKSCDVIGINLNTEQIRLAKAYAKRADCSELATFQEANYNHTAFENESFDIIWAIESLFHTPYKKDFFKEANRLLKPNGKIIIADYFATKISYSNKEKASLNKWYEGYLIPELLTTKQFAKLAENDSFSLVLDKNISKNIQKSVKRLYRLGLLGNCFSKTFGMLLKPFDIKSLPKVEQIDALIAQYKAYQKDLWQYHIILFEKQP